MSVQKVIRYFILAAFVSSCHLSQVLAEGIYHMGSANNQYLDAKTLLFVHVDKADRYINIHLCRRQKTHDKINVRIYATSLDQGIYRAEGSPLAELKSQDNIDCHDSMLNRLPTANNKLKFKAPQSGVYAIDLSQNTYQDMNGNSQYVDFLRWDVTVANSDSAKVNPKAKCGNLFSNKWSFNSTSYSRQASATTRMYVLAPGGFVDTNYVWVLDLNEFSGFVYDVMANDIGLNSPYSGLSVSESANDPKPSIDAKYPVYLNYPTGANPKPSPTDDPSLLTDLVFIDDQGIDNSISPNDDGIQDSGNFVFTADVTGTYAITIDLNKDGQFGANDRLLLGSTEANVENFVAWDGRDANGEPVANDTYDVQLELRIGEYHFVARDVETSGGGSNDDGTGEKDGLTILEAINKNTVVGTRVYWDDKTLLGGSSNLPNGVMSSVNATGDHRHTWGRFSGDGFGNRTLIDTYVYGRSSASTYRCAVVIAPENTRPSIKNQVFSVPEDTALNTVIGQVVAADSDNNDLTYKIISGNRQGLFSLSPTGEILLEGQLDFEAKQSYFFTVEVSDGQKKSQALMRIDVTNVNELPNAEDDKVAVLENSSNNIIDVLANDSDPDGDNLTITEANASSGEVTVNSDGTLNYTPEPNMFGEVEITYTISDGNGGVETATAIVNVTPVPNNPPTISGTPITNILESDEYSFVPVATDPDGEPLTFSAQNIPDWMSFDTNTGALTGTPFGDDVGTYEDIIICVTDGEDETCLPPFTLMVVGDEDGDGTPNETDDDFAPILTAPEDITIDATGLFTPVELGNAVAQDYIDGVLTNCCQPVARIENGNLPWFPPGRTEVIWSVTDEDGNTTEVIQVVNVRPLVSFGPDISVAEGSTATVPVYLNGLSPEYPLEIPFSVIGGTATSDDHSLESGTITFISGTEAEISFDVIEDDLGDDGETIIIELDESVNRGEKPSLTITIREGNLAPSVELVAVQNDEETLVVEQNSGNVVVSANVFDPNSQDEHSYDWLMSDDTLVDLDDQDDTFTFDPSQLSVGFYELAVSVSDNGEPSLSGETSANIRVVISSENIPNTRLDACNLIPQVAGIDYQYIIEANPGNCLRVGPIGLISENGAAWLTSQDFENNDDLEPYTLGGSQSVGGRFDVDVYQMDRPGSIVQIVIPLRASIPFDSSVLLYDVDTLSWFEFNIDDNNQLASAPGELGYCPPPGNTDYQSGLNNGHYCLKLSIEDGGPNDLDGKANGLIETISGAHVVNDSPEAQDDAVTIDQGSENNIINVLSNDSDSDGDPLSVMEADVERRLGQVSTNSDNTLSFTPDPDFSGELTIYYTVSDGNSGTDVAEINVKVLHKVDLETTGGSFNPFVLLGLILMIAYRRYYR
jgi:hypothetical protein